MILELSQKLKLVMALLQALLKYKTDKAFVLNGGNFSTINSTNSNNYTKMI